MTNTINHNACRVPRRRVVISTVLTAIFLVATPLVGSAEAAVPFYGSGWPSDVYPVHGGAVHCVPSTSSGRPVHVTIPHLHIKASDRFDAGSQWIRAWPGLEYWDPRQNKWIHLWWGAAQSHTPRWRSVGNYGYDHYEGHTFSLDGIRVQLAEGWAYRFKWAIEFNSSPQSTPHGYAAIYFEESEIWGWSSIEYRRTPQVGTHQGVGYCYFPR